MLVRPTTQALLEQTFDFVMSDCIKLFNQREYYYGGKVDAFHSYDDVEFAKELAFNISDMKEAINDMWHMGLIPASDYHSIFPKDGFLRCFVQVGDITPLGKWCLDKLRDYQV